MAPQAQVSLADALNRTLVLPLATSSFPGQPRNPCDFVDLYSLASFMGAHPKRSAQPWAVSLDQVSGGAFMHRKAVEVSQEHNKFEHAHLHVFNDVELLIANRRKKDPQPMEHGWMLEQPHALTLTGRSERAFRECLCIIEHGVENRAKCDSKSAPSFIALHFRVENDFLHYSKSKGHIKNFEEYYRYPAQIQTAFREWFRSYPRNNSDVPLYLAFAEDQLPHGVTVSADEWPAGVRALSNSDFASALAGLSYIEQSAVARQLCLTANVFIGNTHSSFTGALIQANTARENYVYNCVQSPADRTILTECAGFQSLDCCNRPI